jgi:hypothetical protein
MTQSKLSKKLRIQPGQRLLFVNAPGGYVESLEPLPEGIEFSGSTGPDHDFVHLFVKDTGDLETYGPAAFESVKYDGLVWISYPKGSSKVDTDLNRDSLWELMTETTGLRPVTQVSVDATWSAIRFRPTEMVGKKA